MELFGRLCAFLLIFTQVGCFPKHLLYRNGYGFDQHLPKEDEISSPEIKLAVPIIFYNEKYSSIFVNSNGFLSFQTEIPTFFNIPFPLDYPVIAPLYTNVDVRGSGSITYRETQEEEILSRGTQTVRENFSSGRDFQAKSVFLATWTDVGYHEYGTDKVNNFQVAVLSDGEDSYVEFMYPEDGIQWIQGTGGESGLPDARAQAGLVSADRETFLLPGSGTDKVFNLMKKSNFNNPGKFIFHIGRISKIEEPDSTNLVEDLEDNIQTCIDSQSQCHSKARCVDLPEGFCCQCQDSYYGNGKSCLKNDVPLRVNGKVNGFLNNEKLEQLDLQSYIVMSDGRAYTAISRVSRSIGWSFQLLQILGGVIGFIFAKPLGEAKNGYQLTGGQFNHTANLIFKTGERLRISQSYLGLDVFDQLKLEAEIQGQVPNIPPDTKLQLQDFEEMFSISSPGVIISQSDLIFRNGDTQQEYHVTMDQKLEYTPCAFQPPEMTSWKLKTTKNFIGFENVEQIIRFGMSTKVGPLGDVDPCKEGRNLCQGESSCLPEGDSYRCVCNPGYQYIYNQENSGICVDVNECQVGLHNCDVNANCYNEPGTFTCVCKNGFEGDGHRCKNVQTCADLKCGENAECTDGDAGEARCVCMQGFKGDGRICLADRRVSCDVVNNCSPYGTCSLNERNEYECRCLEDFQGNGYLCEELPKTTTTMEDVSTVEQQVDRVVERCLLGACWCPSGYVKEVGTIYCFREEATTTEENLVSRPIPQCINNNCICPWGFQYVHGECSPIPGLPLETMGPTGQNLSCNVVNNCHPRAQCLFMPEYGHYQCQCDPYFEGDGYGCSIVPGTNCTEYHVCDVNALCFYHPDAREYFCRCNHGFKGDGVVCEVADCSQDNICRDTELCVYSHEEQKNHCVCKDGYRKDEEGTCHPETENWCGGGKCVLHASCLYDAEYQVNYCHCDADYIGDGITECRPRPLGCDQLNNCGLHANCLYDQQLGVYSCQCSEGYFGDGFLCSSQRTCHSDPYMCDEHASCVQDSDRQYVCSCNPGFSGNGTFCRLTPKHDGGFLLLNQGMATLRVPFTPTPKDAGRPIQIQYYQMAIGLDIDCYEGRVYWSDITGKAIKSSAYNGTNYKDFLSNDIGSPEGLSIDWVSRNIYWTDSSKDTLEVANLETKLRKVLFQDNLVNPRGIAVHPQRGKIFWSDWNRRGPKIEWANMDGTGREIFLQGPVVQLPNSLAIDWQSDNLCYADAGTKKIECVEIDSRRIRTIALNCTYPFGLAISEEHYYWTDWVSQKIESVNKQTLKRESPIKVPLGGSGNKLYGMAAVPEQCPQLSNVCQFYNGQCGAGQLCLPNGNNYRTCV